MESFEFKGKTYTIHNDITIGQLKKLNANAKDAITDPDNMPEGDTPEVLAQLKIFTMKNLEKNELQLAVLSNTLSYMLGLSNDDLDNLSIKDAGELLQKAINVSSTVKKKSEKLLDSPSSQVPS